MPEKEWIAKRDAVPQGIEQYVVYDEATGVRVAIVFSEADAHAIAARHAPPSKRTREPDPEPESDPARIIKSLLQYVTGEWRPEYDDLKTYALEPARRYLKGR